MATTFIRAIAGLTVPPDPLHRFTSRRDFAEFYSSSFPLFALGSEVTESDLKDAADAFNKQAQTELGFGDDEFAEMGLAAAVPQSWQLHEKLPPDAVRWFHQEFNKDGASSTNDPQWYPLGFLGIATKDWRKDGLVIVFYDAQSNHANDKDIAIKAYKMNPEQVGASLIALRQGDDDYENVKRHSTME
jgi:hypothetical protein